MANDYDPPPYREMTIAAVVVSIIVGCAMCAAFTYTALKLSFTLAGSTIAAILGFAMLRTLGRGRGSILEVNMAQTGASAINVASSGVAFTLPALFLLGPGYEFSYVAAILAAMSGTVLGLVVIVPLRKQMVEFDRLRFPSGLAVASILKTPGESIEKAKLLGIGFLISGGLYAITEFTAVPDKLDFNAGLGIPGWLPVIFGLSLVNVAAGLLAGKGGLPFAVGGILAWWIVSPSAHLLGWTAGQTAADEPGFIYGEMLRPLGIGVLVGGAVMGVILAAPAIKAAIASLRKATTTDAHDGDNDEAPVPILVIGFAAGIVLLFCAAYFGAHLPLGTAVATAIVGSIWLALAGLVVAQATGMTDIAPISGMALIGVTLMVLIAGQDHGAVIAAVMIGAAVSVGASQCSDMMQDLKTGHLVGGKPVKQAVMQMALTWIGPAVAFGTMVLLWQSGEGGTGGFGAGTKLPAPQGEALKAVVQSLASPDAAVPWDKYGLGAAIGVSVSLLPVAGVGVLLGLAMYLPAYITFSYGVGCIVSMTLKRKKGAAWIGDKLVPFAAGLILGEALLSLGVALVTVFVGD